MPRADTHSSDPTDPQNLKWGELFEHSVLPMLLTQAGIVVGANRAALELYGYGEDAIGREVAAFVHPDDRDTLRRHVVERVPGRPQTYRLTGLHKDGHTVHVEVTTWGTRHQDRETVIVLLRDLSESSRVADELRQTSAVLTAVMRASPDMVYVKDRKARYISVNRAFENTLGLHHSDVVGRTNEDILPTEHARRLSETDAVVLESRAPLSFSYTIQGPYGVSRTFDAMEAPILDESGALTGLVGVSRDVTERERLREDLLVAERMTAVAMLARGIAHEYNEILTAIQGVLADSGAAGGGGEAENADVRRARSMIERAADLTRQIVAISEGPEPQQHACRIDHAAATTLGLMREMLKKDGIEIVERFDEATPTLVVDCAQVAQVVLSLVVNARAAVAGRTRKQVTITTGRRGRYGFVSVADSGLGASPGGLASPTGEADGATGAQGWPGVGLSVAQRILRSHGGELEVNSTYEQGTVVTALFPADVDGEEEAAPDTTPLRNRTVLVIEDEETTRTLLARQLASAGAVVRECPDAASALVALKKERIHAMLLDLILPGGSGLDVLMAATALPASRQPAVVVFTGLLGREAYLQLQEAGVARILYKPRATPREAVQELAAALAQPRKTT
jgi:PAS domain S-box-containing protein